MEEKYDKNHEEDDIELEDEPELEDEDETVKDKLKKLREKLRQTDKDKRAAMEELQRAKADFLNARRRMEEEKVQYKNRTIVDHIEELLPLCDSFEMALQDPAFNDAPESLQKGIRGIHSQLSSILKNYQVVTTGNVGEEFDPSLHEAVANEDVEDKGLDHKVVAVIQKGYKRNNTVIRPARVTVGIVNTK